MENKKSRLPIIINSIIIAILVIVAIVLTIYFWPHIQNLKTPEGQAQFKEWITSLGFGGFIVILGMQILQVVVPFIPGEILEILAGVMFGPYLGTLLCLIGITLSVLIIYGLVALLGKPFTNIFVSDKIREKWKFLQEAERIEAIYFFAFLLPGTPKDILNYLAAAMKVKLGHLLLISTIARIPSIVLSTFLGGALIDQNNTLSIIILVINIVVFILGIVFSKAIVNFLQTHFTGRKKNKKEKETQEK